MRPVRFLVRRSLLGALAAITLIIFPFGRNILPQANAAGTPTATRGQLVEVGTVDPMALPSASTSAATTPRAMPLRRLPHASTDIRSNGNAPSATGLPVKNFAVLHRFNGVDEIQNLKASGVALEPPDEGLAVGNGYVFNLVNVTGAIYRPNGTLYRPAFAANAFFKEPAAAFTSDPRTYYDASTHTWFATILELDAQDGDESHFDLAVNPSGNPLTRWTVYRVDTTDPLDNGCPCFGDYPEFGIDQTNVYVSTNEFSISAPTYNGAQIYAISKTEVEHLAAHPHYVHLYNLPPAGGMITYHVQPAIAYSPAPAEYFLESLDPNGTYDHRLAVWALTNEQAVTSGVGMPSLTYQVIQSETYGFPVLAQTPSPGYNGFTGQGTTGLVTPDFDAVYELEYINGHLDDSLDTAVTIPGDTGERDGAAWFQIKPVLSGNALGGASILDQGYVATQGEYLLYPHINENAAGAMAMTFTLGGPATYLSAAYATKPAGQSQFSAVSVAAAGVEPDNGFTDTPKYGGVGRWGDYSNGEVDANGNFWLATQYIPNDGDQYANWGNAVFELSG